MAKGNASPLKKRVAAAWSEHHSKYRLEKLSPGRYILLDEVSNPPRGVFLHRAKDIIKGVEVIFRDTVPSKDEMLAVFEGRNQDAAVVMAELKFQETIERLGVAPNENDFASTSLRRFEQTLNDPILIARLPREKLIEAERERFAKEGLDVLFNLVSREALEALSLAEGIEERDYRFYAEEGEVGEVRRQAASAYPLLAPLFARRISLESAIDAKESLVEAVEYAFTSPSVPGETVPPAPQISKAAMGRLRGLSFPAHGLSPEFIGRVITDLPPDWFPKNASTLRQEDWSAFTDVAAAAVGRLAPLTGSSLTVLFESCGGKWEAFRDRVVRGFTDSRPPAGANDAVVDLLKSEVPWSALRQLPKRKVAAAAGEIAKQMLASSKSGDLEGQGELRYGEVTEEALTDWIVRLEAPASDRNTIMAACTEAEIVAGMFAKKVIIPLAAHVISPSRPLLAHHQVVAATNLAARLLFGGKSMVAIAETVREFRAVATLVSAAGPEVGDIEQEEVEKQRQEELKARTKKLALSNFGVDLDRTSGPNDWGALTDIVQAPNGLWLIPLTYETMVHEEGSGPTYANRSRTNGDGSLGLDLCLGQGSYRAHYLQRCRTEGAHLISVRRAADINAGRPIFERLGTAFVTRVDVIHGRFDVNQFMAKTNTAPCDEARFAFEWYKTSVLNGTIALKPPRASASLDGAEHLLKRADMIADICGYQWRDPNCLKRAMFAWGKFVPKRLRQMGFDGFKASPEMNDFIEFLEPGTMRRLAQTRVMSPVG